MSVIEKLIIRTRFDEVEVSGKEGARLLLRELTDYLEEKEKNKKNYRDLEKAYENK